MGLTNFQFKDLPDPSKKKAKPSPPKPQHLSAQKKPSYARQRPLDSATIYGEELFAEAKRKERQIVIPFHPFTKNKLRISKDGNYIIQYIEEEDKDYFNIFYFKIPLDDYVPDQMPIYDIDETKCEKFVVDTLKEVEDKCLELRKLEFLEQRKQALEEMKERDAEELAAKDELEAKQEVEEGEVENEHNEIKISEQQSSSFSENVDETQKSTLEAAVFSEISEKEEGNGEKLGEIRKPSITAFRKIEE